MVDNNRFVWVLSTGNVYEGGRVEGLFNHKSGLKAFYAAYKEYMKEFEGFDISLIPCNHGKIEISEGEIYSRIYNEFVQLKLHMIK